MLSYVSSYHTQSWKEEISENENLALKNGLGEGKKKRRVGGGEASSNKQHYLFLGKRIAFGLKLI